MASKSIGDNAGSTVTDLAKRAQEAADLLAARPEAHAVPQWRVDLAQRAAELIDQAADHLSGAAHCDAVGMAAMAAEGRFGEERFIGEMQELCTRLRDDELGLGVLWNARREVDVPRLTDCAGFLRDMANGNFSGPKGQRELIALADALIGRRVEQRKPEQPAAAVLIAEATDRLRHARALLQSAAVLDADGRAGAGMAAESAREALAILAGPGAEVEE